MDVWAKSVFRYSVTTGSVYYGREYEEKKERQKKTKEKAEALAMAMKKFLNSLRKMHRGAQVKRDGLAITVERRDTSSRIALRHLSHPSSMSGLQKTTLEERLPPEAYVSRVGLSRQSGLKVPGGPHTSSHPNYT